MIYKEIRIDYIPCLEFMRESPLANLYVGPRLSWWQRRRLKKVESLYNVVYLYDIFDGITKDKLSYNFPGVTFPKDFSAETIFNSIRESIKDETDIEISPEARFFIRFDGREFVTFEATPKFKHALSCLKEHGLDLTWVDSDFDMCCKESRVLDPREIYDLDEEYSYDFPFEEVVQLEELQMPEPASAAEEAVEETGPLYREQEEDCGIRFRISEPEKKPEEKPESGIRFRMTANEGGVGHFSGDLYDQVSSFDEFKRQKPAVTKPEPVKGQSPEDVKRAIEDLLMTGFSVDVIKSWLEDSVKLSRLRITKQFRIVLVDYDKEVKMGPLPKTVFLFYLRHPEGVQFSYLQDHVKELRHIYGHLSRNDDPKKMEDSIASLINPLNNSISEKCTAVKTAFLKQVKEEVSKHYYIRGVQGGKKGIALNRDLVEWECEL